MKALILDGDIKFVPNYRDPEPAEGEALIRVSLAGICDTDLELAKGYMGFKGALGHEFVGVVVAAPDKKMEGKRVVGEINLPCNACSFCARGLTNHCPERTVMGISGREGAFAEYLTLPIENLHLVPDNISDEQAVFTEPLAAAFQIERQIDIGRGKRVAVLGDGKLGLLIAQAIGLSRADVTAIGKHGPKLSILKERGIKTCLASEMEPNAEKFDVVIEATGARDGLDAALGLVEPRGIIVLKSTIANRGEYNLNNFVIQEVTLVGSRCGPFDVALAALEKGSIDVEPLIARVEPLENGIFAMQKAAKRGIMKVLMAME